MEHTEDDYNKLAEEYSELTREIIKVREVYDEEVQHGYTLDEEIIKLTTLRTIGLAVSFFISTLLSSIVLMCMVPVMSWGNILAVACFGWFGAVVSYWGCLVHIDKERKSKAP